MSTIGSPIETSLLQAAQAQQAASKARDREKAAAESKRRYADQVDLRVAGVETDQAVRPLPGNDSEQAEQEQRAHERGTPPESSRREDDLPRIDVKA